MHKTVKVWDVPTRLFHWGLVLLVAFMWISGSQGGDSLVWHIRGGITVAVFVVFRLMWGLVGSQSARFKDFVKGPTAVRQYLKSGEDKTPGHNPLGGWMVMALLTVLLVQISTGLFSADVDSYLYDAPLAHHLTADNAARVSAVHQGMIYALLALVLIHVLAIFAYRLFKGKNLVLPMFSGNKQLSVHLPPPAIASWRRACACAGLAGTVVLGLVLGWH